MNESTLIAKVWNFATVLRDAGLTYTDYVSQLTYLLFLKMDDERVDVLGEQSALPDGCRWRDLLPLTGAELEAKYRQALENFVGAKRHYRHDLRQSAKQNFLPRPFGALDFPD